MSQRFTLALVLALTLVLAGAAATADAQTSAASAASAAPAKSAEPPREVVAPEPPLELGEKRIKPAADGSVVEKFLVHSEAMARNIHVSVVLPPAYAAAPDQKFPVLYSLHGTHGPYTFYGDMPPLRAALKAKPMLIVGFDGDTGWYIDSTVRPDSQYETFFFKELIPYIEKNYRAVPEAKARGVSGVSMGGYGAVHFLLVHPEMFASVSALSGAFHQRPMVELLGDPAKNKTDYDRVDIYRGLEAAVAKGVKFPPLYLTCGTEDDLLRESRDLRDWLSAKKIPCEYVEKPGAHTWPFWRNNSPDVIDFHWRSFQGPDLQAR